ncbi:MAG: FAD-dependent oxidoreductase [bacterium]|nr:FAD-dependent oxidoreductase [bacterium]
MANYDFDLGVLGGGSAGLTITAGAAQLGVKTLLVEKEETLGGDCLHYGCVPSKTLIKSAHVYHLAKNTQRYGLPELDIKPVDYKNVAARIKSVIDTIQPHDSEERFCKLGAKVVFGEARFVDDRTIEVNGEKHSAKSWVIATGSSPMIPPVEGLDKTPYITNKEIFSLDKLPESMIVLGAGPIACEMAQAFARLGTKVSVVQRSKQILSKEDKDMADEAMKVMQEEGVEFYLGTSIQRVEDLGDSRQATFQMGEKQQEVSLQAESLLVALGRTLNLDGLGLKEVGVEYDGRGLKLDDRLRTTKKHIYGAGDVTGDYQFTHAAGYEGGIVIRNVVFHLPTKVNYTNMPWCTYTDPELASIGLNEKRANAAGIEYTVWTEVFKRIDRGLAEGEEVGFIKLLLDKNEKPLGIQILGPQAGELVAEWVAIMNSGAKLSSIVSAVHPYPTLAEINKRVIGNLFAGKLYSEKVKKGLKFFFNVRGRACGCDEE